MAYHFQDNEAVRYSYLLGTLKVCFVKRIFSAWFHSLCQSKMALPSTEHLADPCLNRDISYHEVNYRQVKVSVAPIMSERMHPVKRLFFSFTCRSGR